MLLSDRPLAADPLARRTVDALEAVFGETLNAGFAVRLWDGTVLPAHGDKRFTLVLNDPSALRGAFAPPLDLNAGRAFAHGLIDCEGDLEAVVDLLFSQLSLPGSRLPKILTRLLRLPKPPPLHSAGEAQLRGKVHSRARDRAAIGFHYDQPIEFYRTFLGRELVYSCAYFDEGVETLDEAQTAKIDHLLRKLRVKPGERLLDIGCGWGALVVRAAERFGAHALGITLSESQHREGNRRIRESGLEGRARIELRDYREMRDEPLFDKVVSVGMFEHVGRARLREYFQSAFATLRPGGLFMNHGISDESGARDGRLGSFVGRFVFPDGELMRISEALACAESVGFEVRDVENLREHYARTLRAWVSNLEREREAATAIAGERTYRVWRLYMAGSAQGFASRRLAIFQSLLAKPAAGGRVELPATRRDLYR